MSVSRKSSQLLLGVSAIALFAAMSPREAFADCVGTPADGATISCAGVDADGLDATGFTGQTIDAAGSSVINGVVFDDGNSLTAGSSTEFRAVGGGATETGLEMGDNNTITAGGGSQFISETNGAGIKMGNGNDFFASNYATVAGADYGIDAGDNNTVKFNSYWDLTGSIAGARFGNGNTINFGYVGVQSDVGVLLGDNNDFSITSDFDTDVHTTYVSGGDGNTISISAVRSFTVHDGNVVDVGNGNTITLDRSFNTSTGSLVVAGDDTTIFASGAGGTFGDVIFKVGHRALITGSFDTYGDPVAGGVLAGNDLKFSADAGFTSSGYGIKAGDRATIAIGSRTEMLTAGSAVEVGNNLELVVTGKLESTDAPTVKANDYATIFNYGSLYSGDVAVETRDYLTFHHYGFTNATIGANSYADITLHDGSLIISENGEPGVSVEDYSVVTVHGTIDDGYDPDSVAIDPVTGAEMEIEGSDSAGVEGDDFNTVYVYGTINVGDTAVDLDDGNEVFVGADALVKSGETALDTGDDMLVTNYGTVISGNHAIKVKNDSTVYNYGTVLGGNEGLKLDGSRITAYNYGYIKADSEGVESKSNLVLYNYGEIYAKDDAVQAEDDLLIVNHGIIENIDGGSEAQDGLDIDYGVVDNYGIIRGFGAEFDSDGIDFDPHGSADVSSTIYNRKGALVQGYTGIFLDEGDQNEDIAPKTIHNWGTIIGNGGTAIELGSSDDTLIIYDGSRIAGLIDLGEEHWENRRDPVTNQWIVDEEGQRVRFYTPDNDTLDYRGSGPAVIVFKDELPETIVSDQNYVTINGGEMEVEPEPEFETEGLVAETSALAVTAAAATVASNPAAIFADTREYAAADRGAADMVQGLGSVLGTHLRGLGGPSIAAPSAQPGWATVFGGRNDQDTTDDIAGYGHSYGGMVGGIDGQLADSINVGLFFGSVLSNLDVDSGEGVEIETTHVFGGLYATQGLIETGRVEVSVLGGAGFNDAERTFMTNLTSTGDAELNADYTSGFVSPEVALSFGMGAGQGTTLIARPSFRYLGLFTEEVSETGDGFTWTTGSRTTHVFEGRFALSGETVMAAENGLLTKLGATAGVVGYTMMGDDIDVAFDSTGTTGSASFAGSDPSQVGAFGALNLSTQLTPASILFGEVEGTVFEEDAYAVSGKAGLRMNF
jgi:autotransporter-like protein